MVHKTPQYYYHCHNVLYATLPDIIYITIDIPIASGTTQFNVYHILTFPVPFSETSKHETRVTNLPDFVAISSDNRSMFEMSAS